MHAPLPRPRRLPPRSALGLASVLVVLAALPAAAHGVGEGPGHGHAAAAPLVSGETVEILSAVVPIAVVLALYVRGAARRWRPAAGRRDERLRAVAFGFGMAVLAAALLPPIDPAAGELASAHMVQHMLLMVVAAPVLVFAAPGAVLLTGMPRGAVRAASGLGRRPWLRAFWAGFSHPVVAAAMMGAGLWAWHAPRLYELALRDEFVHWLEHASFFGTALLFWWSVSARGRAAERGAAAPLLVFATLAHGGLLAALMLFAPTAWYASYAETTQRWGLTPLEDQQIAGLIMWIPGGIALLAAGLVLFVRWLNELDRELPSLSVDQAGEAPRPVPPLRSGLRGAALVLGLALLAGCDEPETSMDARWHVPGGNPQSGRLMIKFYQCGSCHEIPGIREADGTVGPPLTRFGQRAFIAGAVPNEPDNLIAWILDPQQIEPHTAMPSVGASAPEARDIAAYLYTLN